MSDKLTKRQIANRRQWIAALRSGKYKKGRHRLRHAGRYCCLGVAVAEGLVKRFDEFALNHASARLALGLWRGEQLSEGDAGNLIDANDSGKWKFTEIADLIELDTEARS